MNPTQKSSREEHSLVDWQKRLLPWLIILPTVLVAVFIVLSTRQVTQINKRLQINQDTTFVTQLLEQAEVNEIHLDYIKWITLVKLEQDSFYKRYNQAELLLMSRIFTKYLGFFTGMILAIVGAAFIIGKIKEDSSDLEGSIGEQMRFKIVSSSPGIIFGFLGTILMLSVIWQHKEIEVRDAALYLKPEYKISISKSDSSETKGNSKLLNVNEKEFDDIFNDK